MKSCVISLATNDRQYPKGLKRLEQSLKRMKFHGDFIYWDRVYPSDCPTQLEAPLAFKPFCFLEAKKRGYDLILWIDASGVVVRPLDSIFKTIEQEGYAVFRNNQKSIGEWCSDEALNSFNLTREEALKLPEITGGVIGLNMRNEIAVEFLNRWYEKAIDGITFRGVRDRFANLDDYEDIKWNKTKRVSKDPRVRGHRHDQTVAGIIVSQLGMKILDQGLAYTIEDALYMRVIILICWDVRGNDKIMSVTQIYLRMFVTRYIIRLQASRKHRGIASLTPENL